MTSAREIFLNIMNFKSVERTLKWELGYWVGTVERWYKEGLIKNQCVICKLGPIWRKKHLVMVLDHINGIRNDHRLENLRFLCPNCNSQTETFTGRNRKYYSVFNK